VDAVVTKALTGHVTEKMREHYSSVDLEEKRAAVSAVGRLIPINGRQAPKSADGSADAEETRLTATVAQTRNSVRSKQFTDNPRE
jgi:hypothetical protein